MTIEKKGCECGLSRLYVLEVYLAAKGRDGVAR